MGTENSCRARLHKLICGCSHPQVSVSQAPNDGIGNIGGALTMAGHFVIPEVTLFFDNALVSLCTVEFSTAFVSTETHDCLYVGVMVE